MTSDAVPNRWGAAAASAAGLSALFMGVYGAANLWASRRPGWGALYFEWERRIPLIDWMIVPYMSIDLFFVGAFFLARTTQERRTLSGRIALAILTAGAFFFLLPMTFAFPREIPEGWTAGIYRFLHGFDAPHNLFPSLHIALRTILADLYARRARGGWRWLSHGWFSLIGFSTVFTHQHHLPDILGGFVLAALCFYAVPDPAPDRRVTPNRRVAGYYGIGALVTWVLAARGSATDLVWAWPAAALTLSALGYLGAGPAVYQKVAGRSSLAARLLLGPVRWGHGMSWWYYKQRTRPWDVVAPDLWIGRRLTEKEARDAVRQGVTAVLDLTAEFEEPSAFHGLAYKNIPVLDLTAPTASQLREAVDFISAERTRGVVYVHCKIGYSRSAAVVAAALIQSRAVPDFPSAIDALRGVRPGIVVRPEIWGAFSKRPPVRS